MDTVETTQIEIDATLKKRIAALASQQGRTASELANDILRGFAEGCEESVVADTAEDERRWQEYLRTGECISWEEFQGTLNTLIAQSEAKLKA